MKSARGDCPLRQTTALGGTCEPGPHDLHNIRESVLNCSQSVARLDSYDVHLNDPFIATRCDGRVFLGRLEKNDRVAGVAQLFLVLYYVYRMYLWPSGMS
jgi:hypothetical protein